MRTKEEIASDLALALASLEAHKQTNVCNRSVSDMREIIAYGMELQRKIIKLRAEERAWIEAP